MVNIFRNLLQHIREYCEEAAIHGPQHIVSQRLALYERLVSFLWCSCFLFQSKIIFYQATLFFVFYLIPFPKYKTSNISFSWQGYMVLHIHWRSRVWLPALYSIFGEMVLFTSLYGCRLVKLWCGPNTISSHYNLLQQQNCWEATRKCPIDPALERTK